MRRLARASIMVFMRRRMLLCEARPPRRVNYVARAVWAGRAVLLGALTVFAVSASAEENAALGGRGATIAVTCRAPTPLNDKWNKPEGMLRPERPAGPIINDLTTAEITVTLAVPLHVVKVGILQGDYRGGFAKAKDLTLRAPGAEAKSFRLANSPGQVQFFEYRARTDRITLEFSSVHPPDETPDRKYGSVNQVQVIVEENLDELFAAPEGYGRGLPAYIMRTPNLDPGTAPRVTGMPRKVTEHPFTIWDREDIDRFKRQIAAFPAAREAYEGIVAFCEKTCANQTHVPDEPDMGTDEEIANRHQSIATGIGNLGIGYALSGDERFAKEAKRLLLELADRFEGWPVHAHPSFTHDRAKWSWQRLNEAIWLIPCAWGLDLIWNSPSLTQAERTKIVGHFIMPCVRSIMSSRGIITAPTNWSAICAAAVMIGARVSGDREFYEMSYMGLARDLNDKRGGFFFHLDKGIDDDGMWAEGAIGYQFMAIRGLLVAAEILWHDGIDAYGYRDGRLKKVFDSPLWFCYPGGRASPAVHDSGGASLFGRDAHLYQYAMRRYGDKAYNAILGRVTPTFESVFNLFLPACDFSAVDAGDLPRVPSILFPGVGFAMVRTGDAEESKYLMVDYGPNRSHGHPDKLNFCFYALGQELFADAGSAWYSTDIYKRYYSHSLAHNTVTANETSQIMTGGRLEAYGSLGEIGLIRASCETAIPSAVLDRTMLLSAGRLYDIMYVSSGIPFTLDLPYHSLGSMEQRLAEHPWQSRPEHKKGYAYFKKALATLADGDWRCSWMVPRGRVDMHYVGEPGSELIFGETPKGAEDIPTAMIRRRGTRTVFAGVFDVVPRGGAGSVASLAGIETPPGTAWPSRDGSGYALRAELAGGGYEQLMTSFTEGTRVFGRWKTDARTAFVQVRGGYIAAFYLAGGTVLEGPDGKVTSSTPTLLAYHTVKDGLAQLVNQGEKASDVVLAGIAPPEKVSALDGAGNRTAPGDVRHRLSGGFLVRAEGRRTFELFGGTQPTAAAYAAGIRRAKLLAQFKEEKKDRAAVQRAFEEQYAEAIAEESSGPKEYFVLVQAEDMSAEDGGKVRITDRKAATYGTALLNWDRRGHWLEYEFEVAHDGHYKILLKYCREGGPQERSLTVDGEYPCEFAKKMEMPGTGGWSNGADNWKFYALSWPYVGKPYLVRLARGKHKLRIENLGGAGLNLDYIVIAAPFLKVTKTGVEK